MNKWIKRICNLLIMMGILGLMGSPTRPLAADITALEGKTGYIGKEDIKWGTGQSTDTFTVTTYDGGTATLTKVPDPDAADESVIKGVWYVAAMAGDHGNAALTGSLAWVIAVIDGDPAVVELPGNQVYQVSTNLAVPSTIYLKIGKGGILTPDAARTVDLNGPVGAGAYQIIDETAGGTVNLNFNQLEHDKWRDGAGDAILPSATNTIDLGSITQKFKGGHFAGDLNAGDDVTVGHNLVVTDQTTTDRISGHAFPGLVIRPKFIFYDVDEIDIDAGVYYHNGTTEQLLYWDSQLTYQFTSLAVSDISYLYLDDSAIAAAGTNLITAAQLTDSITEPGAWSNTKHGRYNGEDLCIFAVRADAAGEIIEFTHDGDRWISYNNAYSNSVGDIDVAWVDIDVSDYVPSFATKAYIRVDVATDIAYTGDASLEWRVNGTALDSNPFRFGTWYNDSVVRTYQFMGIVLTDSAQIFELKCSRSGAETFDRMVGGWFLPNGM